MENLLDWSLIKQEMPFLLTPRPSGAHKGSCGKVVMFGGAPGMEGALVLSGSAALRAGCGKLILAFRSTVKPFSYVVERPEIMVQLESEIKVEKFTAEAWAIGCGLGNSVAAQQSIRKLLAISSPVVLDADALNLIAQKSFAYALHPEQHIITPHPGEAARLLGTSVEAVQKNRVAAAEALGRRYAAIVVLKGLNTVVYSPLESEPYVNPTGNCGLATPGSGDVLTGIIAGLIAQGAPLWQAAKAGVYLHGLAADYLQQQKKGPIGVVASDLLPILPLLRNEIAYHQS